MSRSECSVEKWRCGVLAPQTHWEICHWFSGAFISPQILKTFARPVFPNVFFGARQHTEHSTALAGIALVGELLLQIHWNSLKLHQNAAVNCCSGNGHKDPFLPGRGTALLPMILLLWGEHSKWWCSYVDVAERRNGWGMPLCPAQNQRTVWLWRNLKDHVVPSPLPRVGAPHVSLLG